MIDYKQLLIKYRDHFVMCEGTDYISDLDWNNDLSEEEKQELRNLFPPNNTVYPGPVVRTAEWQEGMQKLLNEELQTIKVNQ